MLMTSTFDSQVVVIGSGAGGAVVANTLSKAGYEVLVLEEGGWADRTLRPFSLTELETLYRDRGIELAFGKPNIPFAEGRNVGGGTSVNCGLLALPPEDTLVSWKKQFLLKDCLGKDLAPYIDEILQDFKVSPISSLDTNSKLKIGGDNLGIEGSSSIPTFKNGSRSSLSQIYLRNQTNLNLRIYPNSKVIKLERTSSGWILVTKNVLTNQVTLLKSAIVFVAAGAIQSPLLLRRSGIKKNVGNSFQLHPVIKTVALFSDSKENSSIGVNPYRISCFERFNIENSVQTLPFLATSLISYPYSEHKLIKNANNLEQFSITFNAYGNGFVRNIPLINNDFIYFPTSRLDLELFSQGLKSLSEILFHAGAIKIFPNIKNMNPLESIDDIKKIPKILSPKNLNLSAVHLFATCPMGENSSLCATNSFGKVLECKGLFISDSSILCTSLGENPQLTIMAIAKRNAINFIQNGNRCA